MGRKDVGGQAVIEGVMMRGSKGVATAIRKEDGEIVTRYEDTSSFSKKYPTLNKPLLRGIFVLIDSLKVGINIFFFSTKVTNLKLCKFDISFFIIRINKVACEC